MGNEISLITDSIRNHESFPVISDIGKKYLGNAKETLAMDPAEGMKESSSDLRTMYGIAVSHFESASKGDSVSPPTISEGTKDFFLNIMSGIVDIADSMTTQVEKLNAAIDSDDVEHLRSYMREYPQDYSLVYTRLMCKMKNRQLSWLKVFDEFTPILPYFSKKGPSGKCIDYLPLVIMIDGDEDTVRYMLDIPGFDINSKYGGFPLLHASCISGKSSIVYMMLERGADVHIEIDDDFVSDLDGFGPCNLLEYSTSTNDIGLFTKIYELMPPEKKKAHMVAETTAPEIVLFILDNGMLDDVNARILLRTCDKKLEDACCEYMKRNPETPDKFLRHCFSLFVQYVEDAKAERDYILSLPPFEGKRGSDIGKSEKKSGNDIGKSDPTKEEFRRMFFSLLDEYIPPENCSIEQQE